MKKILATILFFGSVGTAMAQTNYYSPEYYRGMMSGWDPGSPVIRAVTPAIFQAPVQAGQAIYETYRAATNTCPSQRLLGGCPNNASKGYLYLPVGTKSCSVGADLGKYCYKGRPGQKGEQSTIIGPSRFQTELECQMAACGNTVKKLKVRVIVGEAPECPDFIPEGGWSYLRQAPTVPVTFSMSGGTSSYQVRINETRESYSAASMVRVFVDAYSARTISGTVTDSGSPQQRVPFSASVPACKKPRNSCSEIASLISELKMLLLQTDMNSAQHEAIKAKIAALLENCASSAGCMVSADGGSCTTKPKSISGLPCCPSVQGPDDPPCQNCGLLCLSSVSKIATPTGDVLVTDLKVGDIVWTTDTAGNRIVRPVAKVSKLEVSGSNIIHLVLADGRSLDVSGPHPTANGKTVGELKAGNAYDGSVVRSAEVKPYEGTATYDILPAGDTGFYWANGILMGSTMK